MKRSLGSYVVFGNIEASNAPGRRIDYSGLLKILHTGFLVVGSGFLSFLISNIAGINLMPESTTDEMIITMMIIPTLKMALTFFPDFNK